MRQLSYRKPFKLRLYSNKLAEKGDFMRISSIPPINYMGSGEYKYSLPEKHKARHRANIVAGSLLGLSALTVLGMGSVLLSGRGALKKLPDVLYDKKIVIKYSRAFHKEQPYTGSFEYLSNRGLLKKREYKDGYLVRSVKFKNSIDRAKDFSELSFIRDNEGKILHKTLKQVSSEGKVSVITK